MNSTGQPVIMLGMFDEYYEELERTDVYNTRWDHHSVAELDAKEDAARQEAFRAKLGK